MGQIKHIYTSPVADGTVTSVVRPSDWNSAHVYTLVDGVSLSGNTAGAPSLVSSGTLYLAGGNNITLSQNANSITVIAPSTSAQQTGISGIADGAGTATSGTVQFSNANGVSFGLNGQTMTATVATNYDPAGNSSNYVRNWKLTGNTSGTTSSAQGTDLWISGGNSITVSGSSNSIVLSVGSYISNINISAGASSNNVSAVTFNNANGVTFGYDKTNITASVAAQSNQSEGFYAVGNTTQNSSTTLDARTVSFRGNQDITVGYSNGSVQLSVNVTAAQSSQSAIKGLGASNTGNTAGNTGLSTGIDWVLAGSNNITISESTVGGGPNTLWVSGAAGAQTGISGVADGAGTQTKGTVSFANSNGVTFGLSTGANTGTITASVAAQSNQTAGFYAVGNTTQNSSTTLDARTVSFDGLGGITVGFSNGSIQISGPQTVAQTNQTEGFYAVGNTTQNSSTTLDARTVSFRGNQDITVGYSNGSIQLSVNVTGAQSSQSAIKGFGASNTGNTAGNTGLSTGIDWVIAGTSNVTVSESTVGGGPNTLWISAGGGAQSNQTIGFYAVGNTTQNSSTTLDARTVSFRGNQDITVGYSNGSVQLSVNVTGAQSNQTGTVYAAGNTTGTSSGTFDARTISIKGDGAISVAASNSGWEISCPNTSSLSATGWVQISTNGNTISIGATTTANLYAIGNTTGTSSGTADMRTVSVKGDGMISVAASNSGWEISAPNVWSQSAGASNLGNTLGTSGVASGSAIQLIVCATDGLSISQSVNGASASETVVPWYLSQYDPLYPAATSTNINISQNSVTFVPFQLPAPVSAYRLNLFLSVSASMATGVNVTGTVGHTISAALYSRGTGASTDRISSFWSCSAYIAASFNSFTAITFSQPQGISNSTAVSSISTGINAANATTWMSNSLQGYRVLPLPVSSTLTPGRYWLAIGNSSTQQSGNNTVSFGAVGVVPIFQVPVFRPFGTSSAASNASFYDVLDAAGTYSSTTGAFPGSVPLTSDSIRVSATIPIPYFNFSAYTTGTNVL